MKPGLGDDDRGWHVRSSSPAKIIHHIGGWCNGHSMDGGLSMYSVDTNNNDHATVKAETGRMKMKMKMKTSIESPRRDSRG